MALRYRLNISKYSQSVEMLPGFNITPSTSLVLVKKLVSPSYIVYLEALQCPDFNVSIRDVTGSTLISDFPVTLSTLNGAAFSDGSHTQLLNVPYGFLDLRFSQSSIWQVLHTSGFTPAESAANIQSLQVSTLNVQVHSTGTKIVSTLVLENLFTPNSIQIAGTVTFSNLSTTGFNTFESSFRVFGDVTIDNALFVSAATYFYSTLDATYANFQSDLNVSGSHGIGGNLAIGNVLNAVSSLQLTSTIQIDSLQIQRSTGRTLDVTGDMVVGGLFSTLSSFVVGQSTIGLSTFFGVGSLYVGEGEVILGGGAIIDGSVFLAGSLSSASNLTFLSSLQLGQDLIVRGTKNITSSLNVGGYVRTATLSTSVLASLSNMSIGHVSVKNELLVASNLSTFGLFIGSTFSVAEDVQTEGSLVVREFRNLSSSAFQVSRDTVADSVVAYAPLSDTFSTLGNGPFTLGIGDSLQVGNNMFVSSLSVRSNIDIGGDAILVGPVRIGGSLDVLQDMITTTFNLVGTATFDTIEAANFVVNQITVASTFQVSTLIATEISSQNITLHTLVNDGVENQTFTRKLAFVSTIEASTFEVTASTIETAATSYFLQFATQSEIDDFIGQGIGSPSLFWMNTAAFFQQGISTQNVSTSIIEATLFDGAHVGDGAGLTNIALEFLAISTTGFFASTVTAHTLYTSTTAISSLTVEHDIVTTSSFITDTFRIDPIGLPINLSTNQILVISPSTLLINKGIYVDRATQRVGMNTSTPEYNLDIKGLLYASSIAFSSIQEPDFTSTNLYLNDVTTNALFVRDALYVTSTTGILRFLDTPYQPLEITSYPTNTFVSSPAVLVQAYPSTLLLNEMLHITASSVGIGLAKEIGVGTTTWPTASLDILGSLYTSSLQISSGLTTGFLTTGTVSLSTLELYGGSTITAIEPIHTVYQFSTSFIIDNILFVDRYHQTMGIKVSTTDYSLDIDGSAYFSKLVVTSGLNVSSVTYEIGSV